MSQRQWEVSRVNLYVLIMLGHSSHMPDSVCEISASNRGHFMHLLCNMLLSIWTACHYCSVRFRFSFIELVARRLKIRKLNKQGCTVQ